jgi:hypothetical protein
VQLKIPAASALSSTPGIRRARGTLAGADPTGVNVAIGFSLPTREAVDERYAELTSAGHAGRRPPFDAFWGARWAVVADPDRNDIGLMSPIDESRRTLCAIASNQ